MPRMIVCEPSAEIAAFIRTSLQGCRSLSSLIFFETGTEAISNASVTPCDIVLTNQHLPDMSALELANRLHQTGQTPDFIFYSAEKEFDAVLRALNLGIHHYFILPFRSHYELEAAVNSICSERENRFQTSIEKSYAQMADFYAKELIGNCVKKYARFDNILLTQQDREFSVLAPLFSGLFFRAVHISFYYEENSPDIDEASLLTIKSRIENIALEYPLSFICSLTDGGLTLLLSYGQRTRSMLSDLTDRIYDCVATSLPPAIRARVFIGMGSEGSNVESFPFSIDSSMRVIATRFQSRGPVFWYEPILTATHVLKREGDAITLLAQSIRQGNLQTIRTTYQNTIEELMRSGEHAVLYVYDFIKFVFVEIQDIRNKTAAEAGLLEDLTDSWYSIFFRSPTLEDFTGRILELIISICLELESVHSSTSRKAVRLAQKFIDGNYTDPSLSLEKVALHVNLTPSYLSSLFRKEAGISFKDYLSECRIGKAKDLLTGTAMPVSEIASSVGCPDAKYFSKLFRKMTDTQPTAYRKFHT